MVMIEEAEGWDSDHSPYYLWYGRQCCARICQSHDHLMASSPYLVLLSQL